VLIFSSGFESGNFALWSDAEPPACDDGIQDGDESDIDCGGLTCAACQPGEGCFSDSDCAALPAWTQAFPSCAGGVCTMGCSGENYDVNGNIVDGCEVVDSPLGNHSQGSGWNLGTFTCFDDPPVIFNGKVPSDQRAHGFPPVGGFDSISGSAPDHLYLFASGGISCVNDMSMTLALGGSSNPTCYRLTVNTNLQTLVCNTSAGGVCSVACGSGCYEDGTSIYFKVEKTCALPVQEAPTYSVSGHI
jgi:hypothetical protein